jgi:hypothetical protein
MSQGYEGLKISTFKRRSALSEEFDRCCTEPKGFGTPAGPNTSGFRSGQIPDFG